jgi:hypothetical protein
VVRRGSYFLYLWHWPILIIAAERVGRTTLPVGENLVLMVVAVGASMVTYRLVENPIRHWRRPTRQTLAVGATLVLSTVVLLSLVIFGETAPAAHRYLVPAASEQVVLRQVAAATRTTVLPTDVQPSLADVATDWGGDYENLWCEALQKATTVVPCERGDPKGSKLLVVYGDSHAIMWLPAFEDLAVADHWRLVVLGKYYCPAEPVTIVNQATWADPTGPFVACDQWHQWAVNWINAHRPDLLVITQENSYTAPSVDGRPPRPFTTAQWHNGMTRLLGSLAVPSQDEVILGNTPASLQSGPVCLTAHTQDVQACSTPRHIAVSRLNRVDQATALGAGVRYVDPVPWFCAQTCPALIRGYIVYWDSNHITATWAKYLEILLGRAVGLPVPGRAK